MNSIAAALVAQVVFAALAVVLALVLPEQRRALWCGVTISAIGVAGALTGISALAGGRGGIRIPISLPISALKFEPQQLGALFMVVVGAVGAITAIYAIGYAHGPANSRTSWIALAIFLTAMQLVPASADVVSFLLVWELMAISSTVLVLTEYRHRDQVRSAALWYSVMTQLSFVLIVLGFAILAKQSGNITFASISAMHSHRSSIAFVLLIVGFAIKAGIVPLHIWLPRAHPEAPSHVSALMSAAMVKLGVYGAVLVGTQLLPSGPSWWGLLILVLGGLSALYGILQASVAVDLKRLLAYSTTENIGLIFISLGAALLLRSSGLGHVADYALVSGLLLVVAHAAFKTLLFLGAGAVLSATGEGDLDKLGGLGSRMPVTSATFAVGALGAAALPVTAGFVGEWVLFQALIHGAKSSDRLLAVVMPLSVAVVALTAGLALMTFVKAFGITFLGRARSAGAQGAKEVGFAMKLGMVLGATAVVGLGLIPGRLGIQTSTLTGRDSINITSMGGISLTKISATLNPVALLILAAATAIPVLVQSIFAARRSPRRRVDLAWGSGGMRSSPKMQYTATSYAEPLSRIFDDVLKPDRDIVMTPSAESQYLVERVRFRQQVTDIFEVRFYLPAVKWFDRIGIAARRMQNGRIQVYLSYSFAALIVVLIMAVL
ncbi:MAG TPA: proton-conducting transporter membrane subunit [Candidatus Nanopelagicaceae bacterium]|nr:proton-conducting transporter membrane subunit [Candidatus Nanopelagicaceae bacterium]